jgi:hypothetical protein
MQQRQRLKNMDRLRDDSRAVMICTDVAARGLDIPDVQHVIHYQVCVMYVGGIISVGIYLFIYLFYLFFFLRRRNMCMVINLTYSLDSSNIRIIHTSKWENSKGK